MKGKHAHSEYEMLLDGWMSVKRVCMVGPKTPCSPFPEVPCLRDDLLQRTFVASNWPQPDVCGCLWPESLVPDVWTLAWLPCAEWDYLRSVLTERVVYDDTHPRAWFADEAKTKGLVFGTKQGQVRSMSIHWPIYNASINHIGS